MKLALTLILMIPTWALAQNADEVLARFTQHGKKIEIEPIRRAAMTHNGRIKPLDTLAREAVLFVTGAYGRFELHAVQFYFALPSLKEAEAIQVVEVRDKELRTRLGYLRDKRFFSFSELANSELAGLAQPLLRKQDEGAKLNSEEKAVTEAYHQMSLLQQLISGEHFMRSIDFSFLNERHGTRSAGNIVTLAKEYLGALNSQDPAAAQILARDLVAASRLQESPALFRHYLDKLDWEVRYNSSRVFLLSALLSLLAGLLLVLDITRAKIKPKFAHVLHAVALAPLWVGIGLRVYITQFAPVTNMFTTMLWVALGVVLFSWLLFALYRNYTMCGSLLIGAGLILLLTEKIPLVLSPDLDPLVAVLRSNFWLSTHVTTITISYAAFTIAMILGNIALFKVWRPGDHSQFIREYSHYAYRMIQLGCFLLSVGIILGGVWADYSWGRFWGWDPKETWALIADMGFLALLHARYVGWVTPFTLLAYSPIAYLLVIMAWYGVNFILASGLHSYGFSSGGALMVGVFVVLQLLFIVSSLAKISMTKSRVSPPPST